MRGPMARIRSGTEDMTEFELDLVVAVERFAGYEKDGFAIAMEQLSGEMIPAGQEQEPVFMTGNALSP